MGASPTAIPIGSANAYRLSVRRGTNWNTPRRAVGRTIEEICRDLAVMPGFCTRTFWNQLFEIMHYFGGDVVTVMREKTHREQRSFRSRTGS